MSTTKTRVSENGRVTMRHKTVSLTKATPAFTVFKTTDYSRFKHLKGNRRLDHNYARNKLKKLYDSFIEKPLISIVICNEKMEVIDGQRRLTISQELGLPVYYIVVEGYGADEVIIYNTTMELWGFHDFLTSHADRDNIQYKMLENMKKDFPDLSVNILRLLIDGKWRLDGKGNKDFKNGLFTIQDLEIAYYRAGYIMSLKPLLPKNLYKNRQWVCAIIKATKHPDFDTDTFKRKLEYNEVRKFSTMNDLLMEVERVYNWNSRKKIELRYFEPTS